MYRFFIVVSMCPEVYLGLVRHLLSGVEVLQFSYTCRQCGRGITGLTHNTRLSHEHTVYKALSGMPGIPTMHWYGREVPYHVLVLDHLNLTLEEAISKCHDINLVFLYANQMVLSICFSQTFSLNPLLQLSCLKSLHKRSYIHRDVKPTNFMTSIGELS